MRALFPAIAFFIATLSAASPASAYKLLSAKQADGRLRFRINVSNFTNKLTTIGNPSADDYEAWIRWGVGQWRERSGAAVEASYDGRTTAAGCHLSVTSSQPSIPSAERDGINTIDATDRCIPVASGPSPCQTSGRVYFHIENGVIKEVDMCIFRRGQSTVEPYAIYVNGTALPTARDLITTIVHEAGHMYGLDHSEISATVMTAYSSPFLRFRFLTYDDIKGLHARYGARTQLAGWGTLDDPDDNVWGLSPIGAHATPSASIGTDASGTVRVAAAGVAFDSSGNGRIAISSATYPLSATSTWSTLSLGVSDYPVALAASTAAPAWLGVGVARPSPSFEDLDDSCPVPAVLLSSDGFKTLGSWGTIPNVCLQHRAALTFDPKTRRWILVYTDVTTQKLFSTTTLDGNQWTAPQNLGWFAYGGASVACDSAGTCILVFPSAMNIKGGVGKVTFTIAANGGFVVGTPLTQATSRLFHVPVVGVRGIQIASEWYFGTTRQATQPENARYTHVINGQLSIGPTEPYTLRSAEATSMPAIAAYPLGLRSYWFQAAN